MVVNGWKVVAWIFILIFLAETLFIVWAYNSGSETIDNRYKCSNEICFNKQSDAFTYDESSKTCQCWNADKVIHSEVMDG